MKRMMKHTLLAMLLLGLTTACDSKTASLRTQQTASVEWDVVMASDQVATPSRNTNLIFMR